MKKEYFINSKICDEKIKEIILCSEECDSRHVFRAIKHSKDCPLLKTDFYPTIVERHKNVIPDVDEQLNYEVKCFGVSVFDDYNQMINFIETVPALRRKTLCHAQGTLDAKKGVMGCFDSNGHFQYFLFDHENNNPYCDFEYLREEAL